MRQLVCVLQAIDKAHAKDYYYDIAAQVQANGSKISITLEEYMALSFKDESASPIDKEQDDRMSAHMEKLVKERLNGR